MHIQYLRKIIHPAKQNIVGVCNPVTLLIVYSISFRLLEVIDAPIEVSGILYITFSFKLINFSLQIFLLFFLECLLALCLTLFSLSTLLWFRFYNNWSLAHFLSFKKPKHSSSNIANAASIRTDLDCFELRFWF